MKWYELLPLLCYLLPILRNSRKTYMHIRKTIASLAKRNPAGFASWKTFPLENIWTEAKVLFCKNVVAAVKGIFSLKRPFFELVSWGEGKIGLPVPAGTYLFSPSPSPAYGWNFRPSSSPSRLTETFPVPVLVLESGTDRDWDGCEVSRGSPFPRCIRTEKFPNFDAFFEQKPILSVVFHQTTQLLTDRAIFDLRNY